jgi:hypothetical protein
MPPKKKQAVKEVEAETEGPSIYRELVDVPLKELVPNLDLPIDQLLKQNVEFETLVSQLQHTCL